MKQTSAFKERQPDLFQTLLDHPSLRIVECTCLLKELEHHTLHYIHDALIDRGFKSEEIIESVKLYHMKGN